MLEYLLPAARRLGRPRTVNVREIVNGILFLATSGCQWRQLPKDFPPMTTVQRYFYRWRDDGTRETINHALVAMVRETMGREASPTAGVINRQSVKTTEAGGPRGYDAGKCIKGRKRHVLTDTNGLLVAAIVHAADIQDRVALRRSSPPFARSFPGFATSSRTEATLDPSWKPLWPRSGHGPWRSSSGPTLPKDLNCCHGAGWLSVQSLGSTAIAASPRTSRPPSRVPSPGSSSPASNCSQDGWPGHSHSHAESESDSKKRTHSQFLSNSILAKPMLHTRI